MKNVRKNTIVRKNTRREANALTQHLSTPVGASNGLVSRVVNTGQPAPVQASHLFVSVSSRRLVASALPSVNV